MVKSLQERLEDNEWQFPVVSLNGNISQTLRELLKGKEHMFRKLKEHDCHRLLNSKINICDERGWRSRFMCDYDGSTKQVSISAAFCQMIWLICYYALVTEDYRITEEEFSKWSYLKKIKSLVMISVLYKYNPGCVDEKDVYVHLVRRAYEEKKNEEAISLLKMIARQNPVDVTMAQRLDDLFKDDIMNHMVNSLYLYSICFYLLHEFGHYLSEGENMTELMEEYAADALASDLMIKKTKNCYLKSSMYGMTAGVCCLMIFFLQNRTHPDTDTRLKEGLNGLNVSDHFRRKNAGLILSYLGLWAALNNIEDFPVRTDDNIVSLDRAFVYLERYKQEHGYLAQK